MKISTRLKYFLGALLLTMAGIASATYVAGAYTQYVGYNPSTGQVGSPGLPISITTSAVAGQAGALPVIDTTASNANCGTIATVQGTLVGGPATFQLTTSGASAACVFQFDFAFQAPNGYYCVAVDETTRTAIFQQTSHSTSFCTVANAVTTASGDKIIVEVNGY